jgi:hypothetical protein
MRQEHLPRRENSTKVLTDAVQALRSHEADSAESLSDASRSRVFQAVTEGDPVPPAVARLFTPWRRMALASVAPVLLVVAVVGWLGLRGEATAPEGALPVGVEVAKVGDQVVFRISNGDRAHFVSRSERPDRFEAADRARVSGGSYADPLNDDAGLVFYRID